MQRFTRILATLPLLAAFSTHAKITEITVIIENRAPDNGTYLTPFWVGLHSGNFDSHTLNAAASTELERLAEDGNTQPLVDLFAADGGGSIQGVVASEGDIPPLAPGETASASFLVDSSDFRNRFFSYASMVIPSNDAFVGNDDPQAHRIFDVNGNFLGAFFTIDGSEVKDAGTEVNDELPDHTAFFGQSEPNTGVDENGVVHMHPGYLPPGSGGILDDPMFENADFTQPGYEAARVTIVRSDTVVSGGAVSGTWTQEDSPYIITGDIVVPFGETLTIEPGVLVVFENVFSMAVEGIIVAEGTADEPITFTKQLGTSGWRGLRFFFGPDGSSLKHCIFEHGLVMAADPFNSGAAMYIDNASPVIEKCTFRFNRATANGGAIYMQNSSAVIRDSIFTENMAAYGFSGKGGAIYAVDSNPEIVDNVITDNLAYGHGTFSAGKARGGGLYLLDSGGVITGNVFANNFLDAGNNVGAIARGAGICCINSDPLIRNNTFYNNEIQVFGGDPEGGGVYLYSSDAQIINNIFVENEGGGVFIDGFSSPTIEYNDFYNNPDGDFLGNVPSDYGDIVTTNNNGDPCDVFFNIFLDPLFVDAAASDFSLQMDSPAIDAGDPNSPADPDGTIADQGAVYHDQGILGDLNGDGCVDQADLGELLASFGQDDGGDLDGDGDTDQADLGALLSNYGEGC
jgi:parallel beta-helix repeat protein/predicted outer membrane repeat protein